jgi:hypothetical protein
MCSAGRAAVTNQSSGGLPGGEAGELQVIWGKHELPTSWGSAGARSHLSNSCAQRTELQCTGRCRGSGRRAAGERRGSSAGQDAVRGMQRCPPHMQGCWVFIITCVVHVVFRVSSLLAAPAPRQDTQTHAWQLKQGLPHRCGGAAAWSPPARAAGARATHRREHEHEHAGLTAGAHTCHCAPRLH